MRKKLVNILLGITVLTFAFTGCSHQGTSDEITVYGQVTKIDGEYITVALAQKKSVQDDDTKKGSEQSENKTANKTEKNIDSSGNIVLTGEEQIIAVSDKTEVEESAGEAAAVEDIEEGNIVTAVLEGANTKSVTIQSTAVSVSEAKKEDAIKGKINKGSIELTGILQVDGNSENSDDETVSSSKENENVVLVKNGGTLNMTKGKLTKAGATASDDESQFYGVNAVFVTTDGSESSISSSEITSASNGANAVFAAGEDALIHVNNVKIDTSGDSSRGLNVTYGGTIDADDVDILTSGEYSAPIAAGKGGGTVTVTGGTVSSTGENSPCIYSMGEITVENVEGSAVAGQMLVVEGKHSIILKKSDLTSAGENGIVLNNEQSTSEEKAEETARLKITDSKLTYNGEKPMFIITNVQAEADLENTELIHKGKVLVNVSGKDADSKDTAEQVGGSFTLTGTNQKLEGDIICDELSTITINLTEKSTLKSVINGENKGKNVEISLAKDAAWELTGDSYVNVLKNEDSTCSNIESKGHTIYYDSSNAANSWLKGKTVMLNGGGKLMPS